MMLGCHLLAAVGDRCRVMRPHGGFVDAEVLGFSRGQAQVVSYQTVEDLRPGLEVRRISHGLKVPVGDRLLGRVLNGLGEPIDGQPAPLACPKRLVRSVTPSPLERHRIAEPLVTGQRAIDGLITCGKGQRVGIFAGSGVGKSTLLGQIARGAQADRVVLALIGERGREVGPFLEDCLGSGRQRAVVVVATSDESALMRVRAAQTAVTIADTFRRMGRHVLFMLDSLTRLAMAQRELGLALGEPPSARGYTPSVFQLLASLLEQLGNDSHGSITGIVTVLVEGDEMEEPIADASRALLDGHIVLSRKLAERGHFPAIDIAQSVSRLMTDVAAPEHLQAARQVRSLLAVLNEMEELVRIGAYVKGTNPQVDKALELAPQLMSFLRQELGEYSHFGQTVQALQSIAGQWPY